MHKVVTEINISGKDSIPVTQGVASSRGRIIQLDVLRGLAVLSVLLQHHFLHGNEAGWLAPIANKFLWCGWVGVDLFFVLSGFLIGGILFDEIQRTGNLRTKRFLFRRAFKIWPSYFALLAASAMAFCMSGATVNSTIHRIWPNLIHIQNYVKTNDSPELLHTWSLAVEEHFYLLLPLVLAAVLQFGHAKFKRLFVPTTLCLLVCIFIARTITEVRDPLNDWSLFFQTHLRLDALLFGVLLAFWHRYHPEIFRRIGSHWQILLVLSCLLLYPATYMGHDRLFLRTAGFTMIYLSFGCMLTAFVIANPGESFLGTVLASSPFRVVAWIGTISYGIYLWHLQFGTLLSVWLMHHSPAISGAAGFLLWTGIYLAISVLLGFLSTRLIEQPFLRYRDRIFRRAVPTPKIEVLSVSA